MNLTRQEITVICLLLTAVITGGIVRLCRKGWTVPAGASSMASPGASPPPANPTPP